MMSAQQRQPWTFHRASVRAGAPVVTALADSPGNNSVQIAKANELDAPGLSPCVLE